MDLTAISEGLAAHLRQKLVAELARRSGSDSFAAFVKQAWQYVPQCDPLVWNWHMDAICLHLEEFARGRIPWLAVSIPPGHGKSVFSTILLPAWVWTWWPKCQFLFGSYSREFVVRDARRCRQVIDTEWYQDTYCGPAGWGLREDYGSAQRFENTAGGVRVATSVGSLGAGVRAHIVAVDDPINIDDAHSEAAREEAVRWMSGTLSERFSVGYPTRFLLIMQRLHEDDPTAWMLRQPEAQCLRLPTEFEAGHRCVTYHFVERRNGQPHVEKEELWRDPRIEEGELLFPKLIGPEKVAEKKFTLQPVAFAAQHQQRPTPLGGNMFKLADWRFWTSGTETMESLGYSGTLRPIGCVRSGDAPSRPVVLDDLEAQVISVDPTFRETKEGSRVAVHVWGKIGSRRLLLYRVTRRMDFTETVRVLLDVIRRFPRARRKLIEGKANGDAVISTLERQHGVTGLEAVPVSASKVQRAMAMQPYHTAHNVELPDGAPWLEEYIAEHAAFPNGAHDDDVDAQSQGLQGLEAAKTTAERYGLLELD